MNRTRLLLSLTGLVAALSVAAPRATAFPPFTQKEGKPCGYCHVNEKGGGKRNYRGNYYKLRNLSFVEFDDAAEAKKAGEEVGPDPDPNTKPKSWTAPKGAETTEATGTEEKKLSVKEATARVKVAETAYNKAKNDPAKKKALAAAIADLGHATMLDATIPPRNRYPAALKHARRALSLDPTNKQAAEDKKAIEDAYKSMGRPVPQR
ncbi:MAG: hypothetical protein SFU56_05755 [Capsulimonadales bacterium]|nr:hypothetical protein [Capsulimonadales bacterium]